MMTQFPPVKHFPDGGAVEMFIHIPGALGTKRGLNPLGFALALLLCFVATMQAQCPVPDLDPDAPPRPPSPHAADEALLPENGHLSNATYTSDYFGFAFDLPVPAQGHLIMLPLMPERQHALLALQFENGTHAGTITVTAIEPRPGLEVATPEQQQQAFDDWAASGSQPGGRALRYPVPDYMVRTTGRFNSSVRHKGKNYAVLYSTRIKNYNLRVLVASNDQDFLQKSKRAISEAHFYCTQDDGRLTTTDGKPVRPDGDPYMGPTVPTSLAHAAVEAKPALEGIPVGGTSGAVYRNPDLGLQYQFPKGWEVFAEARDGPPRDAVALREHEFLHACSKTLLRIAQSARSDAAQPAARPTITLRALDPSCLVMRIPSSLTDKDGVDNILASLEVLSEFGEIGSDELVSISDHLFMVFHGTIASRASNNELVERWSQVMYATLHHRVLLVWSLMAPNSADLNAMPTTGITLDGAQAIDLRASLTAKR
jgi:hypothetical protein